MNDETDKKAFSDKNNETRPEENNFQYKDRNYWEHRFQTEEEYEWLCTYNDVKEYIHRDVKKQDNILILGCGNSTFSADLCNAGFINITSIDFSSVVINAMKKKYAVLHPSLQWMVSDVRDLKEIMDRTFDFVIEKCCLDALVCDEGDPWNPKDETKKNIDATLSSVARVLKRNSTAAFISIGFQQPHFRKQYLTSNDGRYGWEQNIHTSTINLGMGYFYTRCKIDSNGQS